MNCFINAQALFLAALVGFGEFGPDQEIQAFEGSILVTNCEEGRDLSSVSTESFSELAPFDTRISLNPIDVLSFSGGYT